MEIKRKSFLSAVVSLCLIGAMCSSTFANDVLPILDFSSRVEETFSKETAMAGMTSQNLLHIMV